MSPSLAVALLSAFAWTAPAEPPANPPADQLKPRTCGEGRPRVILLEHIPDFCDKPVYNLLQFAAVNKGGGWEPLRGYFPNSLRKDQQLAFINGSVEALGEINRRYAEIDVTLGFIRKAKADFEKMRGDPKASRDEMRLLLDGLIEREGVPLGASRQPAMGNGVGDVVGGSLFLDLDHRMLDFARGLQDVPFEAGDFKGKIGFFSDKLAAAKEMDWPLLMDLWKGPNCSRYSAECCKMPAPNKAARPETPLGRLDDRWGMSLCSAFFEARELLNDMNRQILENKPPHNTVSAVRKELAPEKKAPPPPPPGQARRSPAAGVLKGKDLDKFADEFDGAMRREMEARLDAEIAAASAAPDAAQRVQALQSLKGQLGNMKATRSRVRDADGKMVDRVDYTWVKPMEGNQLRYKTLTTVDVPAVRPAALKREAGERARTSLLNIFENKGVLDQWLESILGKPDAAK